MRQKEPSTDDPPESTSFGERLRSAPKNYLAALAAVAASLAVHQALRESLGPAVPYLLFYPAVLVGAWLGGLGPGLLATAVSAVAAMYFLLPPPGLGVGDPVDRLSLAIFGTTGCVIAWLSHRLHQADNARRGEATLAAARAEQLNAILDTTVDGIVVIDANGRIEAFNRGAERLFGYTEREVVGSSVGVLMPSPHREEHERYLERYLRTGEARIIGIGREVIARRRDGTVFPVHLSVGEMRIRGERKFTGLLHDLTKRASLDNQLQASEARWRAIVDSAVDGIIVIDAQGRIEAFNPAAEQLFGYTQQEVLDRNVAMLMPSPHREEHDAHIARYLATGKARIIGIGRQVQGLRRDGTTFPAHLSVGEMTVHGERKFAGILHDLSTRVRMEAQLAEQAALAKLGEMAAVLAHEVKNPLAGIRGAIQVVGTRMPPGNPSAPILKEIVARIDSLDAMMKDMLLFARPPKLRLQPTDVALLLTATADLLRQDPALRDIEIEVSGSAPPISADANMLKIVFQNLLINGAHAMEGKGKIRVNLAAADAFCRIAFIDGGPGIPPDVRQQIFVPFFTTKSRGSGLGLPTARRLVEAHRGEIAVDCPPGGGTRVIVRLPLRTTSESLDTAADV